MTWQPDVEELTLLRRLLGYLMGGWAGALLASLFLGRESWVAFIVVMMIVTTALGITVHFIIKRTTQGGD